MDGQKFACHAIFQLMPEFDEAALKEMFAMNTQNSVITEHNSEQLWRKILFAKNVISDSNRLELGVKLELKHKYLLAPRNITLSLSLAKLGARQT